MAQLKEIVVFRDDLYFEGAVQADWFYQPRQVEAVAKSFVFHGPKNHAVARSEFGGQGLMDTASFALHLARKMEQVEDGNAITLAIAGYGTGKSHLAVTLSSLFSGEKWMPELHEDILTNIARADSEVEKELRPLVKKPRLVLTLNGMRNFNLHYELLRTAEKALKLYGANLKALTKLNKVKEIASVFIERSFTILEAQFTQEANQKGVYLTGDALKERLIQSLDHEAGVEFDIINEVYTEFNGHPIRLDEGVSASLVLDTLLQECCGLHGQFDSIVILFDEFGRFLEYVSANPAASGDSALQQIFESVQNAEGTIQFVGFIQSDIKSYLQRVDKSSNISRYIDRYDAGEKIYLSSNLETIFANLLEKKDTHVFKQMVIDRLDAEEDRQRVLFEHLKQWLSMHGIWKEWRDYRRIILEEIYPLHPISTYLLCNLTDWLQSRSSLTLLSEKVRSMGNCELDEGRPLPLIYPVDLLKGEFFNELLNAEEQGRQRSQFCILLNSIYCKFDTKLTDDARSVLIANLIIRICRFRFEQREELLLAIGECTGLARDRVDAAVQLLEDEYAVLSYDDRLICFDFVADSVGANEFRNFLKTAQNRRTFQPEMLMQNDIQDYADILKPVDTDFGSLYGIQTREWAFIQRIAHVKNITNTIVSDVYKELRSHTLPNTERGILLWIYMPKEAPMEKLDQLIEQIKMADPQQAFAVFALDDTDNSLQDAILAYRILADMKEEDKIRYQRFYADAFEKAREKVSLLFADLKQQRKVITENGIEIAPKRLKIYLTSVFEAIYPKVVPFDFEGFDAKGINGVAYKNYCTIMKWILMDDMSYMALKSQSSDVKNRVESLLGPHGLYSWRALSEEYKSIAPSNAAVSRIYSTLETTLNGKKVVPFKQMIGILTASPYGMNEYTAFMFLSLFSELLSYTTRLEIDGVKYSTRTWAEEVLQDRKFDAKLVNKTRLLLVDVGETVNQYRRIYTRIKKNTDFSKVAGLRQELEKLKLEEAVPEEMEAEDDLSAMILAEGDKAERYYSDKISKIAEDLEVAKRRMNPYSALSAALNAQKLQYETYANGRYVYSAEQQDEMNAAVEKAKKIAAKGFEDGWIKEYNCLNVDKLGSYKAFAVKASDLFSRYNFLKEAMELDKKVEKEVARIQLLIDQEAFINECESYLLMSQVRPGMTQKNLTAFLEQANEHIKEFDQFDYEADKHIVELRKHILMRSEELRTALVKFKEELESIWNTVYDISTIDDVRHIHAKIESVLNMGLTDRDREDLENMDSELGQFLSDMGELTKKVYTRNELEMVRNETKARYEEFEVDISRVIDGVCDQMLRNMDWQMQKWEEEFLNISPGMMSQESLDKWKRDTQPVPTFVTEEVKEKYFKKYNEVEAALAKQRVDYILMLYGRLSEQEKGMVLRALKE